MKEIIDILGTVGEIEWARGSGGDNPLRPPFLAWRFKHPIQEVEARIVEAVKTYSGAMEWTIRKGERNWVIEPVAFERFARTFRVDVEASRCFGLEFPSETRTALSDAIGLAGHLRAALLVS